MFTPATIQQSSRLFEPSALARSLPGSHQTARGERSSACIAADPIEFLVERFPVIRRLVGDGCFVPRLVVSSPAGRPACVTTMKLFRTFSKA